MPYTEATDGDSLVLSAARTSATWPMPLINLWQPLYTHLALRGRARGMRRILTGAGGDEWLQVSPQWGFSRLRRLHLGEMRHLYRTYLQSYNLERRPLLKNLLWRYGVRWTARNAAVQGLELAAPRLASAMKERRLQELKPDWMAPDPALAAEMNRRARQLGTIESESFKFAEDKFPFLEHQLGSMEREEAFERGRRLGTETFMPFWDADLDGFLARVPPHLMNQDYWSKGLVRVPLARRFPNAGFETQKKVMSTTLATRLMAEQLPGAWEGMGGIEVLGGGWHSRSKPPKIRRREETGTSHAARGHQEHGSRTGDDDPRDLDRAQRRILVAPVGVRARSNREGYAMGDDREEKEVNAMTSNGTASSWEPLELRLVGRVDEVILGGLNHPCTGHLPPGKTVPAEGDPGRALPQAAGPRASLTAAPAPARSRREPE